MDNPYETPTSDIANENTFTCQPNIVRFAVKLLWASIGLAIISAVVEVFSDFDKAIPILIITSISYSFFSFLVIMIHKGKNWARILFLILITCGLVAMIYSAFLITEYKINLLLLPITQMLLQLSALILLFRKSSSFWFKEKADFLTNQNLQNTNSSKSRGYILGHFHGNKSLESAFWAAGVLPAFILWLFFLILQHKTNINGPSFIWLTLMLTLPVRIFSWVSIVRCSKNAEVKFFGYAANTIVGFDVFHKILIIVVVTSLTIEKYL